MELKITKYVKDNFEKLKKKYNSQIGGDYEPHRINNKDNPFKLHWAVPEDVLWLYATDNSEGYEGSQTQIGIKKDGVIVWGYFSHCSCYGYEDCEGKYKLFEDKEETFKSYEMENVPRDIMIVLKERIKNLKVN